MSKRLVRWFALGLLISIAGGVVYALSAKACREQEAEAETEVTVPAPELQPVA